MEQWANRRKAGWRECEMRERMGFRAWRAEPRHGQFVTRSGTMMENGDILTPMEQPPQCLLYYLPAKDEVILLAPDHTKNIKALCPVLQIIISNHIAWRYGIVDSK